MNRIQVNSGNPIIRIKQQMIDRIGTSGTNGTLNDRGRSGCFLRSTITLAATMIPALRATREDPVRALRAE